ncbi:MFS transporter [Agreia sp. VKM Ac-1783]|uniref:MFS transporter n=1 Tax=Agreia sp. VKM Ac-1783 TaxID=1938889 RepID=UPI000A2AEABB|nr:MFS transporter [Agreia sp. VKM Ac-1783]SMQ73698.1 Major Facilitator Superfamily protein [Agreia sp. VKM Ac-1783]
MPAPIRSNAPVTDSHPSPTGASTRGPTGTFFLVLAVSMSMIQYAFMLGFLNVGIVQIQGELKAGIEFTSWLFLGGQMFSVLISLVAGRLGDSYGRKRVLVILYSLSVIGSLLALIAGGPWLLLIALTLQGAALATPSLASAIIQQQVAPKHVPVAIGWQYGSQSIGSLTGALLGGFLLVNLPFQTVFAIPAALAAAGLILTLVFAKKDENLTRQPLDWKSSSLLTIGFFTFILALSEVNVWGVSSLSFVGCIALSIAAFIGFVVSSRRSANPLIPLAVLKSRSVWMSLLLVTLFSVATIFDYYMLPYFLANPAESGRGFGWTSDAIGVVVAFTGIFAVLGAPLSGVVTRLIGSGKSMAIGFGIAAASQLVMGWVPFPAEFIYVIQAAAGLGAGWAFASVMNAVVEGATINVPALLATIVSLSVVMQTVGNSVGIATTAAIVSGSTRPDGVLPPSTFIILFSIAAVFYGAGLVVALLVRRARATSGELLPESEVDAPVIKL